MLVNQCKSKNSEIKDCSFLLSKENETFWDDNLIDEIQVSSTENCKSETDVYANKKKSLAKGLNCRKDKSKTYNIIKDWEGCITKIDGEDIYAKLYDSSDDEFSIYEFTVDDVSDDDILLLRKGALFFLYIGYYTNDKGTRMKSSHLKFRRIPNEDLEEFVNEGLDTINQLDFSDIWK